MGKLFARHTSTRRRRPAGLLWSILLGASAFVASLPGHAWAADAPAAPAAVTEPALLKPVEPEYPAAMDGKGVRGAVVVELDLGADGKVKKATVVESAGPDFDASALAAAQKLEFSPATQAGKPVPVRIRFRFQFAPRFAAERRGAVGSQGRFDRRDIEQAPAGFSSLQGQIVERGTGKPVIGASVAIPELGAEVVTDGEGRFRFGLLRAGEFELVAPGTDHKPLRQRVTIANGRSSAVKLRAERLSYTVYRATAEAPPEAGQMARRSLGVEEIQRIPGVQGDAFKVVQNLPGVARGTAGSGILVVRGSAPQDTSINVEGVKIPILYHFGGVYSVLNTDMLESIDFYPGGYPVRYGRQTGGLINARLAAPRDEEKWSGYVESNLFHTGFFLKGPLSKDTNIAVAARRSYIDAILGLDAVAKLLPFTLAPAYYDYQLKLDHRISPRTNFTAFFFGSNDRLTALLKDPPPAFPAARGEIESTTAFGTLVGILRHRGDGWSSTTTLGATLATLNAGFGDLFRFDLLNREYTLRQDFSIGDGPVVLRPGLDIFCNPFDIEVYAPPIAGTGERGTGAGGPPAGLRSVLAKQGGLFVAPAAHFDAVFKLRPDLEVVPGLRLDLFEGASAGEALTPRMNVRYNAADRLLLKGSSGMTVQRPQPQEVANGVGNPALLPFRSYETALGFEWKATDAVDVDIQVFNKELRDLVAFPKSVTPTPPVNSGTGRIVGGEVLLRHKPVGRFFGWLAYTVQRATRVDAPGEPERLFGWDQTHILTALGSYKLPDNWELGLRFRVVTGNPITPVVSAVYNEKLDTYTRVQSGNPNSDRLPTFHQLDVRVDKKFVFDSWLLNLYLDVQNAYNRGNPENIQYNYDASAKQYATGLPIIPSVGVRAEF